MYVDRVLFPENSNREDLHKTLRLNDDDTGDPLNLAGVTILVNPDGFTGNTWNVTAGAIATTSTTTITVPGYPLTDELSALALTVGLGLDIAAGNLVTITDTMNRAQIVGYVLSYTPTNGALSVQIGWAFQFEIRHIRSVRHMDDYSPWYSWGGPSGPDPPVIRAALGTGLSIVALGVLLIDIPETTIRRLQHRTYGIYLTGTDSVSTRQLFIGQLPVLYGGVTQ